MRVNRELVLALVVALAACATPAGAEDEVRQIERQYGVVGSGASEGRRLNAQLTRVVERVVGAINERRGGGDFHLRSAKLLGGAAARTDRVVNAFALPDGRIYVTLGLMRAIQGDSEAEDELAFVVGHEVTHVVEKHALRRQKKAMPVGIAAILLGVLTNRTVGGLARLGAAAQASHFSRKDEYAADKGGLKAMYRAGYDPDAAVSMLKRLEALGGSQDKTFNGWFGSHPITQNRIAKAREEIDKLPRVRNPAER